MGLNLKCESSTVHPIVFVVSILWTFFEHFRKNFVRTLLILLIYSPLWHYRQNSCQIVLELNAGKKERKKKKYFSRKVSIYYWFSALWKYSQKNTLKSISIACVCFNIKFFFAYCRQNMCDCAHKRSISSTFVADFLREQN